MKRIKAVLLATVLLLVPGYALASDLGYMRISLIEGDVQVKTPEAGDWGPVSLNGPLAEGDQIWVPEGGRVELQLNTGSFIRLDQYSALQVLSMDKDSFQFYLSQGYAYIFYAAQRGGVIQVDTPDASTRAYDGAVFRVDMSDQYSDVSVYKGYVESENQIGKTRINSGEVVALGQNTNGEVGPMGPPDEWEIWNKARNDNIFASRDISSRYLPDELRVYSSDFNNSGRWVQVPDYGYCWIPTVGVYAGWAPYRNGRWIWRGGEYVWVGNEPWGWTPYHYGRWAFVNSVGWCWVPPANGDVYWSPGYVGWVRTGDYVAWVPLAPRETYYGRGYYGPYSVSIIHVNIGQISVTNVYKNVYVNDGVTVVNRNTFNTASPTIVNVHQNVIQQNIFVTNNISVGGPQIQPSKASYFGSDKHIAPTKLPPQHVRDLSVRQLKESRPYTKDPGKSVLNHGSRMEALPVNKVATPRTLHEGKPTIRQVWPADTMKPAGAPGPIGERPQVKQQETGRPSGVPGPIGERPQVKPQEKGKPSGAPGPMGERSQVNPQEKGKPSGAPGPMGERSQVKPQDKGKPLGAPGPMGERSQVKPQEKGRPSGVPGPMGEKSQVKPQEKGKPSGAPAPQGKKPVESEKERKGSKENIEERER